MIDISYVNGSDSYYNGGDKYAENIATLESYYAYIDEQYDRLKIIQEKSELNRTIMGPYYMEQGLEYSDDEAIYEASKGILAKIGDAVIGVFKFIIGLFDKFIEWIKSFSFRNKDAMTKAEMMMKRHPDIKEEKLKIAISKGYIDFNSMKYFSDLDKAYEKAKKQITAKNKNAVVRGFDTATDALLPDGKIARVAGGVAAIGGGVATVYGGYKWLQSRPAEHEKAFTNERARLAKELEEAVRYKNTINNAGSRKAGGKDKTDPVAGTIRNMSDDDMVRALALVKQRRYNDAIKIVEDTAKAIKQAVDDSVNNPRGAAGIDARTRDREAGNPRVHSHGRSVGDEAITSHIMQNMGGRENPRGSGRKGKK